MEVQLFKNVMSQWATGISVITTKYDGELTGFTANSFASVSIDPMLISMSVTKQLYAGQLIQKSGAFVVNILKHDQVEWGKIFAGFYKDHQNRFEGIAYIQANNGAPVLPDVLAWFACRVYTTIDVGASTLVLGEVTEGSVAESGVPLLYHNRHWGTFQAME